MKRTGKYVGLVITCVLALTFGIGMLTFQNENTSAWLTSIAFLIVGGGYTAVFGITQVACLAAVDHTQQAVVTSCTCKCFDTTLFEASVSILLYRI